MALGDLIALARPLEAAGQWRRAERQWLVVFDKTLNERERDEIRRERDRCARQGQR
ncbi:PerC family transcriptional regulator [Enterobacter ludwigii]|uniref:PerC family transcriptional regulator n=1 Tax=Enterobacter ludwigii TaxID=299767 RepID=UPI003BEEE2D3